MLMCVSFTEFDVDQKYGKSTKSVWLSFSFQLNLANLQPLTTLVSTEGGTYIFTVNFG